MDGWIHGRSIDECLNGHMIIVRYEKQQIDCWIYIGSYRWVDIFQNEGIVKQCSDY